MDSPALRKLQVSNLDRFHRSQADHDSRLARKILGESTAAEADEERFFDWVVTVCFYSGLHYVSSAMLWVKTVEYYKKPFERFTVPEIQRYVKNSRNEFPKDVPTDRHEITKRIVQQNFSDISAAYNRLLDESITARYKLYPSTIDGIAKECSDLLDEIEQWYAKSIGSPSARTRKRK